MTFDENLKRVQDLTGLGSRDAAQVAFAFEDDETPTAAQIIDKAIELGFDVERKRVQTKPQLTLGPEIETNAARVLTETYMCAPRCLPARPHAPEDEPVDVHLPKIGRAPTHLQELAPEVLEQLPEEIRMLLLRIDVLERKATLWLWDEANMIDRPVGPIDLARFDSPLEAIEAVVNGLLKPARDGRTRIAKCITADWN